MSTQAITPRHGKVYRCRYGFHGASQLALFVGYQGDGYLVRKWRANSGRWTAPIAIAQKDLLAKATLQDFRAVQIDVTKL